MLVSRSSRYAGLRDPAMREKAYKTMFTAYILQSIKNGRYYIGHTSDMIARFAKHNAGMVKSTKSFIPWKIIYTENCNTKSEAYRRELEIKSYKGGIKFKRLLGLWKD